MTTRNVCVSVEVETPKAFLIERDWNGVPYKNPVVVLVDDFCGNTIYKPCRKACECKLFYSVRIISLPIDYRQTLPCIFGKFVVCDCVGKLA